MIAGVNSLVGHNVFFAFVTAIQTPGHTRTTPGVNEALQ